MESLMGQKNMICRRIFLPYKIAPVSVRKSSIYITFYCEKRLQKYFMYWLLRQINFFFPSRGSIVISIIIIKMMVRKVIQSFFSLSLDISCFSYRLSNKYNITYILRQSQSSKRW